MNADSNLLYPIDGKNTTIEEINRRFITQRIKSYWKYYIIMHVFVITLYIFFLYSDGPAMGDPNACMSYALLNLIVPIITITEYHHFLMHKDGIRLYKNGICIPSIEKILIKGKMIPYSEIISIFWNPKNRYGSDRHIYILVKNTAFRNSYKIKGMEFRMVSFPIEYIGNISIFKSVLLKLEKYKNNKNQEYIYGKGKIKMNDYYEVFQFDH